MSGYKKLGLLPLCLAGVGMSTVLTALLCLALTPMILRGILPLAAGSRCAEITVGVSVCISVLLASRLRGKQPMAVAGAVAGGSILLSSVVCALGGTGFAFGPWLLRVALWAAAGGIIGAVMSLRNGPPKRRRHRL